MLAAEDAVVFAKACELGLEANRLETGVQLLSEREKPLLAEDNQPEFRQGVTAMPRGAITLADVRSQTFGLACNACGRGERYNVERLIAAHRADVKLPDLLVTLASCEKACAVSIYDRCYGPRVNIETRHRRGAAARRAFASKLGRHPLHPTHPPELKALFQKFIRKCW